MEFKIEDNVPLPEDYMRKGKGPTLPIDKLQPGQSVFLPGVSRHKVWSVINNFKSTRKLPHWIYDIIEREEEVDGVKVLGVRVWRDPRREEPKTENHEDNVVTTRPKSAALQIKEKIQSEQ